MNRHKELLFYTAIVVWGFFVSCSVIYLFFPYQKALNIAFQNLLGGNRIVFTLDGLKLRAIGVDASRIAMGLKGTQGTPLLEMRAARITWNPLTLLKGTLSVWWEASLYDGQMRAEIRGIPIIRGDRPDLLVTFRNVNLARYPEGRFPWLKGMKGTASGWVKKEVSLTQPDSQKGSFAVVITGGELTELAVKKYPRLVLPFSRISVEGTMRGTLLEVTRIVMDGGSVRLRGSGTIDAGEQERIALRLAYEGVAEGAPLTGHGTILISGTQAAPDITISTEPVSAEGSKQ